MCIAQKASAFSFKKQVPQFLFACQCSGRDSEYRSATVTASPRPAAAAALSSRPSNQTGRETGQTLLWHAIIGEATLADPKNGELCLRLVDIKNAHELTVSLPIPLSANGCNVRKEMSKWSDIRIALGENNDQHTFISKPIVKVTGKACYGKDYPLKGDTFSRFFSRGSNRANLAMWELYPIMKHDLVHNAQAY